MAKSAKPAKAIGGPFISAAIFCSSITEDSDGVLSAIRIVDEIRMLLPPEAPTDFPSKAKPLEINLFVMIIIRRGGASSGKHKIKLAMENPDGRTDLISKADFLMPEYPNGAAIIRHKVSLKLHSNGVFWLDVVVDNVRLTRMALNVNIQRSETPDHKPKS